MARISVIMGIYNCADTLPEAIESLLSQTYTDWQLIMCDDGSIDNTYEVAREYVEKYPNRFILVKNEKNMGLNYTLNHCLKYSSGEFIARMDGDDISTPDRFMKEIDFLDANPEYAIVSCNMSYFDEEGEWGISNSNPRPDKTSFVNGTPFCHAPCMVRKEAYEKVGGYSVSNKLLRVEDYHLWIKMYSEGYKGANLPDVLYMMRDDRNAFSRRKFRYRFNENYVIGFAIKKLKLPKKYYFKALRPIIVGMLPSPVYMIMHRRKMKQL